MSSRANKLDELARRYLRPFVAELTEMENDAVMTAEIEATDAVGRAQLAKVYNQAAQTMMLVAQKLGAKGGELLGALPDEPALSSVLHAIDPQKLSYDAIDLLMQDCDRVFGGYSGLPLGLFEIFAKRAGAIAGAENEQAEEFAGFTIKH